MEVYILDDFLRRTVVIDQFESLIWAERYTTAGDFEFVVFPSPYMRSLLTVGQKLVHKDSYRVMEIKSVEDTTDSDGKSTLTVKGLSLESLMMDRVCKFSMANLTLDPKWIIEGKPNEIIEEIFQRLCVDGNLSLADIIPFTTIGTIFDPETMPFPDEEVILEISPTSLYEVIKSISETYGIGYRLIRNGDESELYFNVYTGNDLTSAQEDRPAVIFTPELDNLANITEYTDINSHKNVAYVNSKNGHAIAYSEGASETTSGFDRRVIFVDAGDIEDEDGPELVAKLVQRGLQALAEHKSLSAFDGEISYFSKYKYGRDYNLGDLVEMRNSDGATNVMRVTEQIFVSDAEGDRSYPTLSIDTIITPGSWSSWNFNENWDDSDDDWDDLP